MDAPMACRTQTNKSLSGGIRTSSGCRIEAAIMPSTRKQSMPSHSIRFAAQSLRLTTLQSYSTHTTAAVLAHSLHYCANACCRVCLVVAAAAALTHAEAPTRHMHQLNHDMLCRLTTTTATTRPVPKFKVPAQCCAAATRTRLVSKQMSTPTGCPAPCGATARAQHASRCV